MIKMNKKGKLSASIMSAELDKLPYILTEFKKAKLEYLHLDIMDGHFVPNITLGTYYVKNLRKITDIPFDFHFLVNEPLNKLSWFDIEKKDHVSIHYENNGNMYDCIDYIKGLGAKVFIAINPETDFHVLDEYFNQIDGVLIMHVSPGFSGSKMIPKTIDKVYGLRKYLNENDFDLDIKSDGNVNVEHAKVLYEKGTTIFVSGSGLLNNTEPISEIIKLNRNAIGWE